MSFSKVAKSKVGKGLLAAVALYFLSGLISGSFDEVPADAPETPDPMPEQLAGPGSQVPEPMPIPEAAAPELLAGPEPIASPPPPAQAPPPTAAPQQPPITGNVQQPTPQAATPAGPAQVVDHSTQARTEEVRNSPWYQKLSPSAQAIIAGAMAGGGGAVMNALAMRNAQEAEREREERMRADRARRSQIPTYQQGFFGDKGLVGSRMG